MIIIKNRNDLLNLLPKNMIFAELGVFKGEFSEEIIDSCKPSILYLVDIFEGSMCSGDKDGNNIKYCNMNEVYENLMQKYKNTNVKVEKNTTTKFLLNLQDHYLDAVYIDADHSYGAVKSDLEISLKKVKKGGYILGHDYTEVMFPGVVKAVNEFCIENNLQLSYLTLDGCPTYAIINE